MYVAKKYRRLLVGSVDISIMLREYVATGRIFIYYWFFTSEQQSYVITPSTNSYLVYKSI